MKESETDEILFSNISYLKQFRLNKMGAEVVISDRFLISKFLKGLTHCALEVKIRSQERIMEYFRVQVESATDAKENMQAASEKSKETPVTEMMTPKSTGAEEILQTDAADAREMNKAAIGVQIPETFVINGNCIEAVEAQETFAVTEVPRLKSLRSRKRSQANINVEDCCVGCKDNPDDSKEEKTPVWRKNGAKKCKRKALPRCGLGDSCVPCNREECGECLNCLDK